MSKVHVVIQVLERYLPKAHLFDCKSMADLTEKRLKDEGYEVFRSEEEISFKSAYEVGF
jgi:hypothetical protein